MTCCEYTLTNPIQPKVSARKSFKGMTMKFNLMNQNQSLLPVERLAVTTCLGRLLKALGNLLQEHPELRAGLSPDSGELLVTIGQKLTKASGQIDAQEMKA